MLLLYISYISHQHFYYVTYQVYILYLACELTFPSGGGGAGCGVSLKAPFSDHWDVLLLCLWWPKQIFSWTHQGSVQACLEWQNQVNYLIFWYSAKQTGKKKGGVAAPKPGVVTCDQPGFSWQTTFGQTRTSTAVSKNRAQGRGRPQTMWPTLTCCHWERGHVSTITLCSINAQPAPKYVWLLYNRRLPHCPIYKKH